MDANNLTAHQASSPLAEGAGAGFDPAYLAAKKTIDDRALNRQVWAELCRALPLTTKAHPTNIVEIGAGIGTMLARLVEWGLLNGPVRYLAIDCDPSHLVQARHYLAAWAEDQGHHWHWSGPQRGLLTTAQAQVWLQFEVLRAEDLATDTRGRYHLLIAHAVLDLIDLPAVLPGLLAQLTAGGLAYLTCNFDGSTLILPDYPGEDEQEILRRYHCSMEARLRGASRTGRRLLGLLQRPGLELLAAGSSDWVIHPRNQTYSGDERFFLHAFIATVERELAGPSGPAPPGLAAWARSRHQQVEAGSLSLLVRNLDFLARCCPSRP